MYTASNMTVPYLKHNFFGGGGEGKELYFIALLIRHLQYHN